jgi:hypothetical protein
VCYTNGRVPPADIEVVDNFDDAPQVSQSVVEDGCGRTLRVVAKDYCERESIAERDYLIAQSIIVTVNGVSSGELLPEARITWEVEGLAACASDIQAFLSRDGGAAAPYVSNSLINASGEYSLRLSVSNCNGVAREQVVNFRINTPPVAVPQAVGHPNTDPNAENGYIVAEGSSLTLDGSTSTSPEFDDTITNYTWRIAGQQDLTGPRPSINTLENGLFNGSLEVTDSLGRTHSESLQITITDIDPIPDAGGPYVSDQGIEIQFDAGRSRSINADADPITRYVWSWNDGTPDTEGVTATHTFTAQGAYNVKLTVHDEDSSSEVIVGVIVADVDPSIDDVYVSKRQGIAVDDRDMQGFEVMPLEFTVIAQPGANSDPITRYQWDFDGDNLFDVSTDEPRAEWQFVDSGPHAVGVLVRDRDSFTFRTEIVDVKPLDFEGVFEYIGYSIQRKRDEGALNALARARLRNVQRDIDHGIWGQRFDELDANAFEELELGANVNRASRRHLQNQGVSYLAAQRILSDLVQVQRRGTDFGLEIWALSRQIRREIGYDQHAVSSSELYDSYEGDVVYQRRLRVSGDYLLQVTDMYNDPEFEDDVFDTNQTEGQALILQNNAKRSLDWINIATDQCSDPRFDSFNVDAVITNPPAYFEEAEEVRALAYDALVGMLADMQAYVALGGDNDPGPARDFVANAAASLEVMLEHASYNMSANCNDEDQACATNQSALEIELEAMDLIERLQAANVNGAYVMHWQSCLVEYLWFRIKSSLVAVRAQCGLYHPLYMKSANVFAQGEELLTANDDIIGALNFYTAPEQRCLILDVYNKCLVRVDNTIEAYPYPDICLE